MRRAFVVTFTLTLVTLSCTAFTTAADDPNSFLDAEKAGFDFAAQGEYTGELKTEEGPKCVGIQVIALGTGQFQAVAHMGGLPGDGWDRSERHTVDGRMVDGVVRFERDTVVGTIRGGVLTVTANGNEVAELKRVVRESETLKMKPPEGAIVLFDGKSSDEFDPAGKLSDDGLLIQGVTSKRNFQNFQLHLEFRLPFQPLARGQGRGNSGCYLQGRFEVQMLDSFGLEGKNNECGGIYSIRDPSLNMCFPPLSWQTYDIDFTAATFEGGKKSAHARMTVKHNGVVVQDNVELDHATTASPLGEGPEPGPIYLQDHGNPVRYRNIWVVERK